MIGSRLTVGHQRNSTVSAMRGGRLTARYILRRARPWLTEVRMEVNQGWEDETLRIFRPWFSPLNECAARLNHSVAPLQPRHLSAMHFNRGNASASTHGVNNPVVLQQRSLRSRSTHEFAFAVAGAFSGVFRGASPRRVRQSAAMRTGIPSATCSKMRLRGPSATSGSISTPSFIGPG